MSNKPIHFISQIIIKMEDYRIQPKDVIVASIKRLKEKLKWAIAIVILLSVIVIVNILISSIYIPVLKKQNAFLNSSKIELTSQKDQLNTSLLNS